VENNRKEERTTTRIISNYRRVAGRIAENKSTLTKLHQKLGEKENRFGWVDKKDDTRASIFKAIGGSRPGRALEPVKHGKKEEGDCKRQKVFLSKWTFQGKGKKEKRGESRDPLISQGAMCKETPNLLKKRCIEGGEGETEREAKNVVHFS